MTEQSVTEPTVTHTPGPFASVDGEVKRLYAINAELLAAAYAAIAYDAAIHRRGFMGDTKNNAGEREHYATGDDLDTLYMDWIAKARAAIAKVEGGAA